MKAPKDHYIIQIEVTNACVHTCSNCTRFCGMHKKPFFMDYDTFCKAVDSIIDHPGVIGVMGGEPTLHPQFEDMCKYLQSKIPEQYRVKSKSLKYPTDDFIDVRRRFEQEEYEIYEYEDGPRVIMRGAGLWTTMTPSYQKNLEIIQDTFNFQSLNDHTQASYHQPILISYKDLGISEEKWLKLRENCWINQHWSSSITPKGCFFCEVAAAMDYLFDGFGGLPIEAGWWKRDIEDFKEQFKWCEYCGIPLKTFSRDAREGLTDISPSMLEKIQQQNNIRDCQDRLKPIVISNNKAIKSEDDISKYHGNAYVDDAHDRISEDNVIYAKELIGVYITDELKPISLPDEYNSIFSSIYIVSGNVISEYPSFSNKGKATYENLFTLCGKNKYIVLFTFGVNINKSIGYLKKCVINSGVMHYHKYESDFSGKYVNVNSEKDNTESVMLISSNASSLREMDLSEFISKNKMSYLFDNWHKDKIIDFEDIDLFIYGNEKKRKSAYIKDTLRFYKRLKNEYGFTKVAKYFVTYIKKYNMGFILTKIKYRFF